MFSLTNTLHLLVGAPAVGLESESMKKKKSLSIKWQPNSLGQQQLQQTIVMENFLFLYCNKFFDQCNKFFDCEKEKPSVQYIPSTKLDSFLFKRKK